MTGQEEKPSILAPTARHHTSLGQRSRNRSPKKKRMHRVSGTREIRIVVMSDLPDPSKMPPPDYLGDCVTK
jgi:hypothetical protein